jgi:hypothetical protein
MKRKILGFALACGLSLCTTVRAQESGTTPAPSRPSQPAQPRANQPGANYSGTYAFLRDAEFVQVTVEEAGRVTGFVSRYGDLESDKGAFLDQFFKQGKLEDNRLTFTTETVHGVWFEFKGTVERGEGKQSGDEAYYVLRGTLIQNVTDANKKVTSSSREVSFKSFPQDLSPAPAKHD